VVVGVGENPDKAACFSAAERVQAIAETLADVPNLSVLAFQGLTVRFARAQGARVLLRGVRALADVEYEFTITLMNSALDTGLETVFLMADKKYGHLSSSLIRQIARFGGDLDNLAPAPVVASLRRKFGPAEVRP
jgi:pantetheine-phosphate adenylyltransferase